MERWSSRIIRKWRKNGITSKGNWTCISISWYKKEDILNSSVLQDDQEGTTSDIKEDVNIINSLETLIKIGSRAYNSLARPSIYLSINIHPKFLETDMIYFNLPLTFSSLDSGDNISCDAEIFQENILSKYSEHQKK